MTTQPFWLTCAAALLVTAAGCGGKAAPVEDVVGQRLDVAQKTLDDAGLGYEVIGGGALGVIVESHWRVCEQRPSPGRRAKSVELVVARSCPKASSRRGVPDVTGLRLDVAERELGERELEYYVYADDEVIIRTNWTVCSQYPEPGEAADEVELYVEHFACGGEDDD